MADEPEILFENRGAVGLITLNRPKALNALTHGMVLALHAQLKTWAADDGVGCVVIQGAGERAFCAGGDIRALYDSGKAHTPYIFDFYRDEYLLNAYIKHYPKPYMALMSGIVMGGGVGVSVHGSYRVADKSTVFAMPETGIGTLMPTMPTCTRAANSRAASPSRVKMATPLPYWWLDGSAIASSKSLARAT